MNNSNEKLFVYILIFVIIVFISSKKEITSVFNIYGVIIATVIIYLIYTASNKEEKVYSIHDDLNTIFREMKEFYNINTRGFEEMVGNTSAFMQLYSDMKKGLTYCSANYDVAKELLEDTVESMEALSLSVEPAKRKLVTEKITKYSERLRSILENYLSEMKDICNVVDTGPNPYNFYKNFSK